MTPRIFLFGLVAIGAAVAITTTACSDKDITALPDDAGGTNGEGGTGPETGSAADAGSNDSAFVQFDSAPPDAGQCVNEPILAAGYQTSCSTCLATECCAEVKACGNSPDCKSFAQCYAGCKLDGGSLSACQNTCIAGKDGGALAPVYNPLNTCGGTKCHNDGGAGVPLCPF